MSICLSICLSVCLSAWLYVCLFYLCFCSSVYLFVCRSVDLWVCRLVVCSFIVMSATRLLDSLDNFCNSQSCKLWLFHISPLSFVGKKSIFRDWGEGGVRDIWGLNFPWNLKIQCHRTIIKEIPNISPKANFADRTGLCRDHIKDMYLILWKKPFEDTCHNSWLQALSVEKLLPFRLFTLLSVIWGPKLAHENIALVLFFGRL